MKTIILPKSPAGQRWYTGGGLVLIALGLLYPTLVWAWISLAPRTYEATATFDFYPGHPVNAEESQRALWDLLPHDHSGGVLAIPGEAGRYQLLVTLPDARQAAERANACVNAMTAKVAASGTGYCRMTGVATVPTKAQRLNYHPVFSVILLSLNFGLMGLILWANGHRAQMPQLSPA